MGTRRNHMSRFKRIERKRLKKKSETAPDEIPLPLLYTVIGSSSPVVKVTVSEAIPRPTSFSPYIKGTILVEI